MNPPLIAALALAGLASAWPQRAIIRHYTAPPTQTLGPDNLTQQTHDPSSSSGSSGPSASFTRPTTLAIAVVSALLLGALATRLHPGLVLAAACWLALCSVPLAFIDAVVRRLPDVLTGSAFAGTVLLLLAAAAAGGTWHVLSRAVLGGIALAGCYLVLVVISPAGMGMGDVKAAAGLGSMLAWRGWSALVVGGLAGFLFAAVYGAALLITGRATPKQQIPFGPFMIAGAFLAVLLN